MIVLRTEQSLIIEENPKSLIEWGQRILIWVDPRSLICKNKTKIFMNNILENVDWRHT